MQFDEMTKLLANYKTQKILLKSLENILNFVKANYFKLFEIEEAR